MKTKLDCPFDDAALCWAMRLTGLLLAVGSIFFLTKDLVIGATDDLIFTVGAGLGLLTFGISMMPLQQVKQRAQNFNPKKHLAPKRRSLPRVQTT